MPIVRPGDENLKTLRRLTQLSREERRALRAALWAVPLAQLSLLLIPFRRVVDATKRIPHRKSAVAPPERLSWAVGVVSRRLVRRNRCLVDAVALSLLLQRNGTAATIRFGAMRRDGRFEAHAWVESGGRILIGGEQSPESFAVFPTFADPSLVGPSPPPDGPIS